MGEWMDEWMDEWLGDDEWMNEWANEWMNEWINHWRDVDGWIKTLLHGHITKSLDQKKANVPQWIVEEMNERAKLALGGNDEKKKHQIELELQVLGLTWNDTEECLYNIHGIGKKFDASDAEHML